MNSYEAKQVVRKSRLEARAVKTRTESERIYARVRSMSESIPFGQPILIGHHSEQRDRNFRDRIHTTYGKAFDLQDKASYYENKAKSVGTGGISSDDPDAIEKLRAELANMEESQRCMKAANKVLRTCKEAEARIATLVVQGFSQAMAAELVKPDACGCIGFPSYALSNNNANIRRVKLRIAQLQQRNSRETVVQEENGYVYREDSEENRVMFEFPGKPNETTRGLLKRYAFKWSPSRNAWVRQLNNAGLWAAKSVRSALDAGEPSVVL